jgi:Glycosyltransferase family 87
MIWTFQAEPSSVRGKVSMVEMRGTRELAIVLTSVLIQMLLGFFLGHYFDQRVFMAAGYVVGSGGDPYKPIELVHVFENPLLNGFVPTIGYPPPWPLVLGLIYRVSYGVVQNVFIYNFATKIPIIMANIALAYLVRKILLNLHSNKKKAEDAWFFLLFNPFIILTTAAWGQIDSFAALLCISSLYLVTKGRIKESAFLLAISIAVKPVALALVPLPLLLSGRLVSRKNLLFLVVLAAVFFLFVLIPFAVLGWSIPLSSNNFTNRFGMAGGLTVFSLAEIIQGSPIIPSSLWLLGFLWVPALFIGYYFVYRNPPCSMGDIVTKSIGLVLVFFLMRSWLSEPNLNLLLPFMLIAVGLGKMEKRVFHLFWIIPLVFMVFNFAFPQLFFLIYPSMLDALARFDLQFGTARLVARFFIAVFWTLIGMAVAFKMLRGQQQNTE